MRDLHNGGKAYKQKQVRSFVKNRITIKEDFSQIVRKQLSANAFPSCFHPEMGIFFCNF
jgi:ubiquinone biosynthesis protein COQ9